MVSKEGIMNRKKWLVLVTVIASLSLFNLCDVSAAKTSKGGAPSGKVIVGTFGGDTVKVLSENVNPIIAKDAPNVKIIYAIGMNTERMTKLRVEKGGASSFDVIHVNDRDMQILINEGLLLKLDETKIPNAKKLISRFKNPYYIPYNFSANVILYNKDKVTPAPNSWETLWDPKYKGKIGVMTNLS
jgi:putative spermidine/putrescine transport system substrate-binding protein